ncbi:MAG: hypothetical protein QXN35_07160, partial [Ignisphaera sp.]
SNPASISGEAIKIGIAMYMLLELGVHISIKPARASDDVATYRAAAVLLSDTMIESMLQNWLKRRKRINIAYTRTLSNLTPLYTLMNNASRYANAVILIHSTAKSSAIYRSI